MNDAQVLIETTRSIVDRLDFEELAEFLEELGEVSFAETGSLDGTRVVLKDWKTSLDLQEDPEWQRQMTSSSVG